MVRRTRAVGSRARAGGFRQSRSSGSGVVAGAGGDDSAAGGAVELDAMKRSVAFEVLRLVDEAILTAQICVDDAEVIPDDFGRLIEEDDTAALGGELLECLLSFGEE